MRQMHSLALGALLAVVLISGKSMLLHSFFHWDEVSFCLFSCAFKKTWVTSFVTGCSPNSGSFQRGFCNRQVWNS
jgi:hypothetical protein